MEDCKRILIQQLETMEQMVKTIKAITRAYDYADLDLSKIENDIVEVIEGIEGENDV